MGKLGVIGLSAAAFAVAALFPVRDADAQDFGQSWIDRITHKQDQDRGPLNPKAFDWTVDAGVQYAFDNNIFLTDDNETSDSIIIPFVQAGFTYTEARFEVEGSLLANYKFYTKEDADDDEERVFLRARQTSSRWNFEISELFQNISDPSGVVFLNRVSRVVSTTVPKLAFDLTRTLTLELGGALQIVRFQDQPYSDGQENNNFSVDTGLVFRTPWAFDVVAQFSYYNINYIQDADQVNGTVDVFGYVFRIGFRGNLSERLSLEGTIGYSTVETDFFPSTNNDIEEGTMVANLNFRWEATDKINFYLDFARLYTFNGFGDPFQLINSLALIGTFELADGFTLRGRLQYEISETALNVERNYLNASFGANWKFSPHWVADAGLSYRWGKTENVGDVTYSDIVFSIGLGFSW